MGKRITKPKREPLPPYVNHARSMTVAEFKAEAVRLFGPDKMAWRFVCPSCGHVAAVADWLTAGATEGEAAFSCVGRHLPNASDIGGVPPCNYAGGGLFQLNPIKVLFEDGTPGSFFAFALEGEDLERANAAALAERGCERTPRIQGGSR